MKKMKLFSKILASVMTVSVLSLPVYAEALPESYVNNDYITSSEEFDYTFRELLEMDNDKFMELDKYNGDYPADLMPWHAGYNDICDVLRTLLTDIEHAENLLGLETGFLSKSFETDKQMVYKTEQTGENNYAAVIPFYTDSLYTEEAIFDSKCILIENLTNEFWINSNTDFINNTEENGNAEFNQKINPVWLAKQLNKYFGDEIGYACYEELNWKTKEPTGRIKISFDMDDDKLSLSKENVIYSAKILNCLRNINYDAWVKLERNLTAAEQTEDLKIFDSAVKVGDADSDGCITVRDCAEIADKLSKHEDSLTQWSDYNLDEKVNVRDAAAIALDLSKAE